MGRRSQDGTLQLRSLNPHVPEGEGGGCGSDDGVAVYVSTVRIKCEFELESLAVPAD